MKKIKVLALIPARSGSKRVKNKNIKMLNNKPLIYYSIKAAIASGVVDRVIVSTDSEEIAEIAKKYGAEVPFLRPKKLASDNSTEYEYHKHTVDWLIENEKITYDLIVNLYPTTPFRSSDTIEKAVNLFKDNFNYDSLRSVVKCSEHPYKMLTSEEKELKPFIDTGDMNDHTLSYHLLPKVYIQNASIYITKTETLKKFKNTIGEKILSFIMNDKESIDINSPIDFKLCEAMMKEG